MAGRDWGENVREPRIGVAVVTMGNRPAEVDALLESVAKQDLAPGAS